MTKEVYDKIDETRKEVVAQLGKWRMLRDLEMDELRRENERLREALAAETATANKLRAEVRRMSEAAVPAETPNSPGTSSTRRKGITENGRTGVSLWNNTDEEKEKVYAVLKDGRV